MKVIKDDTIELIIKESATVERTISLIILVLAGLLFFTPVFGIGLIDPMPIIIPIVVFIPLLITIILATDDQIIVNTSNGTITITRKSICKNFKEIVMFADIKNISFKGMSSTPEHDNTYRLGYTTVSGDFKLIFNKPNNINRSSLVNKFYVIQSQEIGEKIAAAVRVPFVTYPAIFR